jgi:hypothetical protein
MVDYQLAKVLLDNRYRFSEEFVTISEVKHMFLNGECL